MNSIKKSPERELSRNKRPSEKTGRKVDFRPALKPQKKLLIVLGVGLVLWIAVLLTLYFTTVAGVGG